ncbi:hypothetical protein [Methanoculleus chikugoensis]|nr:hypothetical protein [Methanoculleus chikugoensis]MDD4567825.1 hypothetical protein [Methanoculleus chikugoensis]NMA09983.1 hypothetical protein [Methanomicrobiales archaeon]
MEMIPAGDFPPLSEIMQQAISAGAKVAICEQPAPRHGTGRLHSRGRSP